MIHEFRRLSQGKRDSPQRPGGHRGSTEFFLILSAPGGEALFTAEVGVSLREHTILHGVRAEDFSRPNFSDIFLQGLRISI